MIQGLTEFLPVSSSGHLALAQYFFDIKEPQLFFDVMLHVGTLGAIIAVFWRDILDIFIAIFGGNPKSRDSLYPQMTKKSGRIFALMIILATVPTVVIALVFSIFVERLFVTPWFVSIMLFVTGAFLFLSGRILLNDDGERRINTPNALIIGIAQGIAVLPGISRSGSTISTAMMRGINRQEAARFSLLMSVPAILGATVLELKDISEVNISIWVVVAGTIVAFVVGYIAIKFLLRELRKGNFSKFAYYCWGISAVSIIGYLVNELIFS
jgi:undecaprenyl-diphosphatase